MIASDIMEAVLRKAVSTGGDYAELFLENTLSGLTHMIDNKVETAVQNRIFGAGIRIFKGLKSVYACTNDVTLSGLLTAAEKAASAIGSMKRDAAVHLTDRIFPNIHPVVLVGSTVEAKRKTEIVKSAYYAAKEYGGEISQASVSLLDKDSEICVATTEGFKACDRRIRTRLYVQAIASKGSENQVGSEGPGASAGYEFFEHIDPAAYAKAAAKQAVTMLHAAYCPAGKMTVAIENGFGGVIFHEACGHSLEAERVSKGLSQFSGKLGQKIASEKVTAIDDGTIPGAWGSLNFDDEGTPTQRNVLIENGILKSYMVDKLNGRRMNLPSTGSGRRQGYLYAPVSRMTNTYIAEGKDDNEEIIKTMESGLYAKKMGGGSVNPVTGEFNFAVTEGYLVKNGVIGEPVRGASLIGKGSEILIDIDMVGKNLAHGQGMCGAESGSIPTNVGQPLIRVKSITVGGR